MLLRCLLLILLFARPLLATADTLVLRHAPAEARDDARKRYYWEVLDAALDSNRSRFGDFRVITLAGSMPPERELSELTRPDGRLDIMVHAASEELDRKLLAVRLPLDKGLTGYRVFLARQNLLPVLSRVKTLDDLQRFSIGQQTGWQDVLILRRAAFTVVEAARYADLFPMLSAGRFDLLSRGVNEAVAELAAARTTLPDLALEPGLLLYYPLPRYFYLPRTPAGRAAAERIRDGLVRIMASGRFDQMYQRYKARMTQGLDLAHRRLLRIPNPTLAPDTPPADSPWWDVPRR